MVRCIASYVYQKKGKGKERKKKEENSKLGLDLFPFFSFLSFFPHLVAVVVVVRYFQVLRSGTFR